MATPNSPTPIPDDALAYDTADLARMLRVGTRTIWRWSHSGLMPAPTPVGGRVLWPAQVIRAWVAAGMRRCDAENERGGR